MCQRKPDIQVIEFLDLCKDGLHDKAKQIFGEYPDKERLLLARDPDRKTCLHLAAYYGHEDVMEFLLAKMKEFRLSVDPLDELSFTPLLYACYRCYDQDEDEAVDARIFCVKALVEAGADINFVKPGSRLTALHWAAFNDDKVVVQFLLNSGAQMVYSARDETPIDIAGMCENYEIVQCILRHWWRANKKKVNLTSSDSGGNDKSQDKLITTNNRVQASPGQDLERLSADHNIHLRYDNSGNASGEAHQNIFRILYWAAFIGKTTIVEHIIRLGYSPYIKAYDQQNAIMGAVEGGSLEVINLILSFNYVPTNLQKFEASKDHRDARGNNPMHLAYKLMHKDIQTQLGLLTSTDFNKRNNRGFLPIEMNHKKFIEVEVDQEADYLFVVKKNRSAFLISQLLELQLQVKELPSARNKDHTLLVIYFSDNVLDQMAEINSVQCRLLDYNQSVQFKNHAEELYEQFQARQKQFLMMKIFNEEIDIDYYQKVGIIVEHFPLHDEYRKQINLSWHKYKVRLFFGLLTGDYIRYMQPINFIANYYGEKTGFYFAWLLFYTSWLMVPALPGLALFIYQMTLLVHQYRTGQSLTVDNPLSCLYCLIMAMWSTIMIEVWKRREAEIAHLWNVNQSKNDEIEDPSFKADLVIDLKSRSIKKMNFADTYARRLSGETPTVIAGIAVVVGCFVGYWIFSHSHKGEAATSVGSSVVNALIIIILGIIYRSVAKVLAKWENHRYNEDYENSLVTKNFAFQFVNAYIALFTYAFADQDFNQLAQNLAIILILKQIAMNAIQVILPMIIVNFKQKRLDKQFKVGFPGRDLNPENQKLHHFVESQLCLMTESTELVMKYSEIIIQLGYIVLFAQAFPLAPFFSILCNFIELRSSIDMLAFYSKRFPAQAANGIGSWKGIAELISLVGVGVNCAIIYFTSNALQEITEHKYSSHILFMLIVMIEHLILIFKYLIAIMIKDKPQWVADEEHERTADQEKIYELLDQKKDDCKARGEKLLDEQVNAIKDEQQKKIAVQLQKLQQNQDEETKDDSAMDYVLRQRSKKKAKRVTLQDILKANKRGKGEALVEEGKRKKDLKKEILLHSLDGGNNFVFQMPVKPSMDKDAQRTGQKMSDENLEPGNAWKVDDLNDKNSKKSQQELTKEYSSGNKIVNNSMEFNKK